jgi:hypothetical protein
MSFVCCPCLETYRLPVDKAALTGPKKKLTRNSDAGQQAKELKPGKERSLEEEEGKKKAKKRREESREMQNLQFSLIINNCLHLEK